MPRPLDSASPGIIVKEIDLTTGSIVSESDKVAGIVAPFAKGPVDVPTLIANENELLNIFGEPYPTDKHYEHWLTASSYLSYGGEIIVIRSNNIDLKNGLIGFSIGSIEGESYFCPPEIDPDIDYNVNYAEFNISLSNNDDSEAFISTKSTIETTYTRPRTFYTDYAIEPGQPDQWVFRTSGISEISYPITTITSLTYGNDFFVIGDQLGKIAASTDGISWILRTSGITEPTVTWTDGGFTTIADFSQQISGTSSFNSRPNTGKRISTTISESITGVFWTARTAPSPNGNGAIDEIILVNGNYVYSGRGGTIAISTNGIVWQLRTSGFSIPTVDGGLSIIASASSQISGTTSFDSKPNTGKRITTISGSGTVTTITNNLLGAASLTASTSNAGDDNFWTLTLPWNIDFNGTSYSQIYVGTNSYITFGGGSTAYSGLSASNPSFNKIMISAADNSGQRIYYGTEGVAPNRTYRVRFEGTNSTSGTLGSPTMVWEAIFYENITNQIDIQIGSNSRHVPQSSPSSEGIVYGNVPQDTYLVGGNSGALRTSTDTITWEQQTSGTESYINTLSFGNNTYVYGVSTTKQVATSTNAIQWVLRTVGILPGSTQISKIRFTNSNFVAIGTFGLIAVSTDAITWVLRTSGNTNTNTDVTFGISNSIGYYLVSGNSGQLLASTDTISWTSRNSGTGSSINALVFGNNIIPGTNTFYYGGNFGTLASSTDTIIWTLRTSNTLSTIRNFVYNQNNTNTYACGDSQTLIFADTISVGIGDVTPITNNLLGPASLTASYTPDFIVGFGNGLRDGVWSLIIPWNIQFIGTSYSQIFVGANGYITFGSSSSSSVSNSSPPFPKITISGHSNNSARRIFYGVEGTSPNRTYRVRFEGISYEIINSSDYPATNMVWEAIFYENTPNQIDIQIGDNARQTATSETALNKIIYQNDVYNISNNNIFVGVGYSGTVLTSTDSINWRLRTSGTTLEITNLIYQSNGDDLASPILTTVTDGSIWSRRTCGINDTLNDIIFGGNVYVAGSSSSIISSTNGVEWALRTSTVSASTTALLYKDSGLNNQLPIQTVNATVWNRRTSGTTANLNSFIVTNGNYITAGSSGVIIYSTDTITWEARTSGTTTAINTLFYEPTLSEPFIIAGASGILRSSTNAIVWTARTSGTTSTINRLLYAPILSEPFIIAGSSGILRSSTNAIVWTARTSGTTSEINRLLYTPILSEPFIIAGASGILRSSTNAIVWTARTSGTTSTINTLFYEPTLSEPFIIAGASGILRSSTNAIVWTARTSGTTTAINEITYTDGIFKTAGDTGTIRTSTDTVVWVLRTSNTTNSLRSFAYQNNTYVCGDSGTVLFADNVNVVLDQLVGGPYLAILESNLITSTNAIIWTRRTTGTTTTINGFTHGNSDFVIAGNNGVILSSTNAIQWTLRTCASLGQIWGESDPFYTFSAIASASDRIPGTSTFNSIPNTGQRITTNFHSATLTDIPNSLLGPASLTLTTTPNFGSGSNAVWSFSLPWNINYNGTSYGTLYVSAASIISFVNPYGGSNSYDLTTPPYPKILISAYYNRYSVSIYYGTEGVAPNRTYRIRYQSSSYYGTLIWEAVFYENTPNQFDIQMGSNAGLFSTTTSPNIDGLCFGNGNYVYAAEFSQSQTGYNEIYVKRRVIATSTNASVWILRTSGIQTYEKRTDNDFTAICSANSIIPGTTSFNSEPFTSKRITTNASSGNVNQIPWSILGPGSLTLSETPTYSDGSNRGHWQLTLPFNISYNGTPYNVICVDVSSFVSFGPRSQIYYGFPDENSPLYPKITISGGASTKFRIYYGVEGTSPNRIYRVRFEGGAGYYAVAPNVIWEMVFYENTPNQIDVHIEDNVSSSDSFIYPPFINRLRYVNGNFAIVGSQSRDSSGFIPSTSGMISVSTNAIHWTLRSSGFNGNLRDISFGNGYYLASGDNGIIIKSTDTISWQVLEYQSSTTINSLTFNPNGNFFTYVGNSGTIGDTGPASIGPIGGPFVAVGQRGLIMTSTNAIVWTLRTSLITNFYSSANKLKSIAYGEVNGKGLYVSSGDYASYYGLITQFSTDAIHWKFRTMASVFDDNVDMIYVEGIENKFISVNSQTLATSTDTIVWTLRALPGSGKLNSLYYNDTTNDIVVSGTERILYSTDAIVWKNINPLGASLPPSDGLGYYPYNYNIFYITNNDVLRTFYESEKNIYIWVGKSGNLSYKKTGKIATSSIQNSISFDYEHGYNVGDEIYVNILGPGSWEYDDVPSLTKKIRKTYVLDVISPYVFKINPELYSGNALSVSGVLNIQRHVWKSAQYTIKSKLQYTSLEDGSVSNYYLIELTSTSSTKITSPMNIGDVIKIKFLDGPLTQLENIETPIVNAYNDTKNIAIVETPELENLLSIGDNGNLLFFPQGIGAYPYESTFIDSPSGYTVKITVNIPYEEIVTSGLPVRKRIYIEDYNPGANFYGSPTYDGNLYGIYGNSGWYDIFGVEPDLFNKYKTNIYVEWLTEAPKYENIYVHVRWDTKCTTPIYIDDVESEDPILCMNICESSDIFIDPPTSVKIKSLEHYRELGYDDNSLGGAFFVARNPGSWSNGINIAVIDSKADQILTGISSTQVGIGYEVIQSLSGTVIPGIGTTYVLDGYLSGVITGIGSDSIDVKILNYVSNSGIVESVDYQQNGVYRFSDSGIIGIGTSSISYSSALDWFDQQTLQITGIGTIGSSIKWNSIAPRPQTTKYASERNSRFDEIHVVVIDSLGTISGNPGTILEKHLSLSKAKDAQFSVGTPSYWRKYLETNSNYIFALDTPTNIDNLIPGDDGGGGGGGSQFIPTISVSCSNHIIKEWKVKFGYYTIDGNVLQEYNNGTLDAIDNIDKYEIFEIVSNGYGDLSDLSNILTGSTLDTVKNYINNGGILWFNSGYIGSLGIGSIVNSILNRLGSTITYVSDTYFYGNALRSSNPFVISALFPEVLWTEESGVFSGGDAVYQSDGEDTFVYEVIGNGLIFVSGDTDTWEDGTYQSFPPDEFLVPMYNLKQIFTPPNGQNEIIGKLPPSPEDPDYAYPGFTNLRFRRTTEDTPIAESLSRPLSVSVNWSGTANQSDFEETLPNIITFPPGEIIVDLTLTPVDDGVFEGVEELIVEIDQGSNYLVSPTQNSCDITIYDNESSPNYEVIIPESQLIVSVICISPNASEPVPDILPISPAIFRFSRTYSTLESFNSPLSVNVEWSGTADQNDFEETIPSVIVFPPRSSYVNVVLTPIPDGLSESLETITATITENPNYLISNQSATATIRDVDLTKDYRLFISIIDEDDSYDFNRQTDWNTWANRVNAEQNIMIVLRPVPQYGEVTKPEGWNGIEIEVERPGEGGGNSNYAQILSSYLENAYFIQFAVDNSGSMSRNTVAEDLDSFIAYLQTTNIVYREVDMEQSEAWIAPHLY